MTHYFSSKSDETSAPSSDVFKRAYCVSCAAAELGFDWQKPEDILDKMVEEIEEIREATQRQIRSEYIEEVGDLFFALVNFNRKMQIDSEEAFKLGIEKFERRFAKLKTIVEEKGRALDSMSDTEFDEVWKIVKAGEHRGS